jgi:hypothetical protein
VNPQLVPPVSPLPVVAFTCRAVVTGSIIFSFSSCYSDDKLRHGNRTSARACSEASCDTSATVSSGSSIRRQRSDSKRVASFSVHVFESFCPDFVKMKSRLWNLNRRFRACRELT